MSIHVAEDLAWDPYSGMWTVPPSHWVQGRKGWVLYLADPTLQRSTTVLG